MLAVGSSRLSSHTSMCTQSGWAQSLSQNRGLCQQRQQKKPLIMHQGNPKLLAILIHLHQEELR
jgi:hypothetical protein